RAVRDEAEDVTSDEQNHQSDKRSGVWRSGKNGSRRCGIGALPLVGATAAQRRKALQRCPSKLAMPEDRKRYFSPHWV
ncbi:hypothetical protein B8W95_13595, partial [Staphylococcus pasteuri]